MRRGRFGLSAIDKREIWSRWKTGETLHEIGRAYGKCHNTIRAVLLPRGGIPPLAGRRSRLALTFAEREDISRGMASGSSIREIARHLHRATSTVSREVARHGGRPAYRAYDAIPRPRRRFLQRANHGTIAGSIGSRAHQLPSPINPLGTSMVTDPSECS